MALGLCSLPDYNFDSNSSKDHDLNLPCGKLNDTPPLGQALIQEGLPILVLFGPTHGIFHGALCDALSPRFDALGLMADFMADPELSAHCEVGDPLRRSRGFGYPLVN